MDQIYGRIKLRPIRLSLLTRPKDSESIRRFLQYSACMWGGAINSIVPVFSQYPRQWRDQRFPTRPPKSVPERYIRHHEPDLIIESEVGLLEQAGLGALREQYAIYPRILSLEELFTRQEGKGRAELSCGIPITDVMREVYQKERQFEQRRPAGYIYVSSRDENMAAEAMFGCYPAIPDGDDFHEYYQDVFQPEEMDLGPDVWKKVFIEGAGTPLRLGRYALKYRRTWQDDLTVFVYRPENSLDVLDLWNIRAGSNPVIPVPLEWLGDLQNELRDILRSEIRTTGPVSAPFQLHPTVEFGKSIDDDLVQEAIALLTQGSTEQLFSVRTWRSGLPPEVDEHRVRFRARALYSEERPFDVPLQRNGRISCHIPNIVPTFAPEFGAHGQRWVNVVTFMSYGEKAFATILPFNTMTREWPKGLPSLNEISIGSEGWVYLQHFRDLPVNVYFYASEEAVLKSFSLFGIEAELSEPGYIAKQILEHLGGLSRLRLLKDDETLRLLNDMAGGVRVRAGEGRIERFQERTRLYSSWLALINKRNNRSKLEKVSLQSFTEAGIIQLGLQTKCEKCMNYNWHSLDEVAYQIRCDRCRQFYSFPQGALGRSNSSFHFRTVGPFASPDFARGSYSTLLSVGVIAGLRNMDSQMSFAPSVNLTIDDKKMEIDFAAWHGRAANEGLSPPALIIGECKSLGVGNLLKASDIEKMKLIARRVKRCFVVFSVMRPEFTPSETQLLIRFVRWTNQVRQRDDLDINVVLLTSHELFFEFDVRHTWRELGKKDDRFKAFDGAWELIDLSYATIRTYLDANPFDGMRRRRTRKGA